MEFEELKVIWDAQDARPLYALDERALHASVRRRGVCIEKYVGFMELFMVAALLVVAGVLAGKLILRGEAPLRLPAAGLMLLAALAPGAWLLAQRARRRRLEQAFEPSLRGDLDKAISQLDYQIAQLRSFPLWFLLPLVALMALSRGLSADGLASLFTGSRVGAWVLMLAAGVLSYACVHVELRWKQLPRKRDLEALRDKLVGD